MICLIPGDCWDLIIIIMLITWTIFIFVSPAGRQRNAETPDGRGRGHDHGRPGGHEEDQGAGGASQRTGAPHDRGSPHRTGAERSGLLLCAGKIALVLIESVTR